MNTAFAEAEARWDAALGASPLRRAALSDVLIAVHMFIDAQVGFAARAEGADVAFEEPEEQLSGGLPAALGLLLACANDGPHDDGAAGAEARLTALDPEHEHVNLLCACLALAQVAPRVHQGWLTAEATGDGFVLGHASGAARDADVRDTVATHLYEPLHFAPTPATLARYGTGIDVAEAARAAVRGGGLTPALDGAWRLLTRHHVDTLQQPGLLTDDAFAAAFGFSRRSFVIVQCGLLGLADLQLALAAALREAGASPAPAVAVDGGTPEGFTAALAAALDGEVERDDVAAVLRYLTADLDARTELAHVAGGYWPPLTVAGGRLRCSPHLIRRFTHERNLLFALSRLDHDAFSAGAAQELEPRLIGETAILLGLAPEVELVAAAEWEQDGIAGEYDLLALDPVDRVVVHVQAKAVIPAEAPSMVALRERRMLEGAEQLRRFRDLGDAGRAAVIARRTGADTRGWALRDVLLTRSGFGSERAWRLAETVTLATPGPLLIAADAALRTGVRPRPAAVLDGAVAVFEEIVAAVAPVWREGAIEVAGQVVRFPELDLDGATLARARLGAAGARERVDRWLRRPPSDAGAAARSS